MGCGCIRQNVFSCLVFATHFPKRSYKKCKIEFHDAIKLWRKSPMNPWICVGITNTKVMFLMTFSSLVRSSLPMHNEAILKFALKKCCTTINNLTIIIWENYYCWKNFTTDANSGINCLKIMVYLPGIFILILLRILWLILIRWKYIGCWISKELQLSFMNFFIFEKDPSMAHELFPKII